MQTGGVCVGTESAGGLVTKGNTPSSINGEELLDLSDVQEDVCSMEFLIPSIKVTCITGCILHCS
jgi:hypothetical protein